MIRPRPQTGDTVRETITADTSRRTVVPRGMMLAISCAIAALMIVIDQVSKQFALLLLETDERIPLIGDLLGLQLAFNTGAAFSIGASITPLITLLGAIASILLVWAAFRSRHLLRSAAIGMILGGALGNLADRIIAPPGFGRGAVTDFLAYGDLFIGNIADVAIGAGVLLILFTAYRDNRGLMKRTEQLDATAPTVPSTKTPEI